MYFITVKEYKNHDDSEFPRGTINYPARHGTVTYLYKTKELYLASLKQFAIKIFNDIDYLNDEHLDFIKDLFEESDSFFNFKENLTEEQIVRLAEICYQEMNDGFFEGSPIKFGEFFFQEENIK